MGSCRVHLSITSHREVTHNDCYCGQMFPALLILDVWGFGFCTMILYTMQLDHMRFVRSLEHWNIPDPDTENKPNSPPQLRVCYICIWSRQSSVSWPPKHKSLSCPIVCYNVSGQVKCISLGSRLFNTQRTVWASQKNFKFSFYPWLFALRLNRPDLNFARDHGKIRQPIGSLIRFRFSSPGWRLVAKF